jgi:flagellar hook assembly protein FlgD
VLDLEIDHNTGEMFIITDIGMMSYRTDATYEDTEYSNVTVFPNPARPEYSGPITIQGIQYDSDVKITDIAGNLVYKTTSNGGTATWDGKTLIGERVATGVYLIWTASNVGKGRKVGKVLVVN